MNAIEENHFVRGFRQIASLIPKPKAILCVSAHLYFDETKVTEMNKPKTNRTLVSASHGRTTVRSVHAAAF